MVLTWQHSIYHFAMVFEIGDVVIKSCNYIFVYFEIYLQFEVLFFPRIKRYFQLSPRNFRRNFVNI